MNVKKKRKTPVKVSYQEIYTYEDQGYNVKEIAEDLEISESTVYAALRARKERKTSVAKPKELGPFLRLEVMLPDSESSAELKVHNYADALIGTINIAEEGLLYRRPNQKGTTTSLIRWETLDKLCQLGIT